MIPRRFHTTLTNSINFFLSRLNFTNNFFAIPIHNNINITTNRRIIILNFYLKFGRPINISYNLLYPVMCCTAVLHISQTLRRCGLRKFCSRKSNIPISWAISMTVSNCARAECFLLSKTIRSPEI